VATKSVRLSVASIGSPCQTKRPVAAKLFEIDEREFHVGEPFDDLARVVLQHHGTVGDANLRERRHPVGARLQRARQCFHVAGPVRSAARRKNDPDDGAHQGHVRNLDAADQELEKA
jgi:hypothetical protein